MQLTRQLSLKSGHELWELELVECLYYVLWRDRLPACSLGVFVGAVRGNLISSYPILSYPILCTLNFWRGGSMRLLSGTVATNWIGIGIDWHVLRSKVIDKDRRALHHS